MKINEELSIRETIIINKIESGFNVSGQFTPLPEKVITS